MILYLARMFMGIALVGSAIKLMDDSLDQELDRLQGKTTLAMGLKEATLPYSLLFLSLSILFIEMKALSLFLSSYILGMHNHLQERQPLGLKGYQESLLLFLLALFFIGFLEILTSLTIILSIQILDDLLDYYYEPFPGRGNLIKKFGKGTSLLLLFLLLASSILLAPVKSLLVLFTTPFIIYSMEKRYSKKKVERVERE